jgi:hypothetical protein
MQIRSWGLIRNREHTCRRAMPQGMKDGSVSARSIACPSLASETGTDGLHRYVNGIWPTL